MRLTSVLSVALVLGLGLFLLACESDDGFQGGSSSKSCDAGETKACGCTDGTTSSKVCGDDDRWKACACGIPNTTPPDPYADVKEPLETITPDDGQCTPDCASKQCGDDGCGGSCAQCPGGMACVEYECVSGETTLCGAFLDCMRGCYVQWEDTGNQDACDETSCPVPQDDMDALMPVFTCLEEACPGDAVDPACAIQALDVTCVEAAKECRGGGGSVCNPQCDGKTCGDDGCGGSCGSCDDGASCVSGSCQSSECSCGDQVCGPNACGESCGFCDGGMFCLAETCSDDGSCMSTLACGMMCLMSSAPLESCLQDYCAPDDQYDPGTFLGLVSCIDENCGHPAEQHCIEAQFGTDSGCSQDLMNCVNPPME